jgi:hypothetical protein
MADCRVTCRSCTTKHGTRVWRWLCEDCADECRARHYAETGHVTELSVTVEPSVDEIKILANRAAYGLGW